MLFCFVLFCQLYVQEAQTPPLMNSVQKGMYYAFHHNKTTTNAVDSSAAFAMAN
jgi:hypothetical protein